MVPWDCKPKGGQCYDKGAWVTLADSLAGKDDRGGDKHARQTDLK